MHQSFSETKGVSQRNVGHLSFLNQITLLDPKQILFKLVKPE